MKTAPAWQSRAAGEIGRQSVVKRTGVAFSSSQRNGFARCISPFLQRSQHSIRRHRRWVVRDHNTLSRDVDGDRICAYSELSQDSTDSICAALAGKPNIKGCSGVCHRGHRTNSANSPAKLAWFWWVLFNEKAQSTTTKMTLSWSKLMIGNLTHPDGIMQIDQILLPAHFYLSREVLM